MPIRVIGGNTAMTTLNYVNTIKENWVSVYLEEVNLFGACFSLYFDGDNQKLHLLDLDKENARTLTNTASRLFFEKIDQILNARFNAHSFNGIYDIYLYHTDGYITEFNTEDGQFKPSREKGHYYKPFKKITEQRLNALRF